MALQIYLTKTSKIICDSSKLVHKIADYMHTNIQLLH